MKSRVILQAVIACLSAISMAGCSTTNGPGDKSGMTALYCSAYRPVHWSQQDSDQTILAVKANNAVFDALCP